MTAGAARPEARPDAPSAALRSLRQSLTQMLSLAWPMFIGQIAVIAFATVDTALVARYSTPDLAALGVGISVYVTTFVAFMGIVMAVSPIVGQAFGAKRHAEVGHAVHQAVWIALASSLVGCALMFWPDPFLWLAKATPEVADKVRSYLLALAVALPASLLFSVYRGFNTAVSRPKAVMAIQLLGLAFKVPLSALLVFGWGPVPSLGVTGCGVATAIVMWLQCIVAWRVLRGDSFYDAFELHRPGEWLRRIDLARIKSHLRLGIPMGLGIGVEVMGFTFMTLFLSRLGTTVVAGHQIAVNVVSIMFMMPLALSTAASTIVAQQVGARELAAARRSGWHGMAIALIASATLGLIVASLSRPIVGLYAKDAAVVAVALPLLAWVSVFHVADAMQTMAAFVLRAWHIATAPMLIYVASLIGVGLGGGWLLVYTPTFADAPAALRGAQGYWFTSTLGLILAALSLTALLAWAQRQRSNP